MSELRCARCGAAGHRVTQCPWPAAAFAQAPRYYEVRLAAGHTTFGGSVRRQLLRPLPVVRG